MTAIDEKAETALPADGPDPVIEISDVWKLHKLGDEVVRALVAALRHDTIGFIFQSYNLIPFLSAVENVELPLMFEPYDRKSLRKRAMELLDLVGLGHRVHHQPTKMSGGEQQRTAIARSLISNPTLVLADEPTANLDHKTG